MPVPTIKWVGGLNGRAEFIDQTKLPGRSSVVKCWDVGRMWEAIKILRVRGAPAIGIAAALGTVLGVRDSKARNFTQFKRDLKRVTKFFATARPTAVNLFWALERLEKTADTFRSLPVHELKERLLEEAKLIIEEDNATCRAIGENGERLIPDGAGILTHCNAGGLATACYGTALAVIFRAKEKGKKIRVYCDETRPLLQGARLTTWELLEARIETLLICDNMAAEVMKEGKVDLVIVGADRIASNGDTANKIGTYGLALLARAHKIPFYVAAPISTFDFRIPDGSRIPIEERPAEEVTNWGGRKIAPAKVKVYNPAFDVTPAHLVTAIITERGIVRRPDAGKIRKLMSKR